MATEIVKIARSLERSKKIIAKATKRYDASRRELVSMQDALENTYRIYRYFEKGSAVTAAFGACTSVLGLLSANPIAIVLGGITAIFGVKAVCMIRHDMKGLCRDEFAAAANSVEHQIATANPSFTSLPRPTRDTGPS